MRALRLHAMDAIRPVCEDQRSVAVPIISLVDLDLTGGSSDC
jgi:hypothetical protein